MDIESSKSCFLTRKKKSRSLKTTEAFGGNCLQIEKVCLNLKNRAKTLN